MASKAASEVSKTPTKKRKSGEDYEAPSSSALVAVAATAYASLARGPLAANTEGARKLAAYVGDGVATCVQSLVDSGLQSEDLRGLRTAVALGGLRGADEAEAGAARSKARRDGIQRVVAPSSSMTPSPSPWPRMPHAASLPGMKQGATSLDIGGDALRPEHYDGEGEVRDPQEGPRKERRPSSSEAAACAISRIVLRNDPRSGRAETTHARREGRRCLHAACRASSVATRR